MTGVAPPESGAIVSSGEIVMAIAGGREANGGIVTTGAVVLLGDFVGDFDFPDPFPFFAGVGPDVALGTGAVVAFAVLAYEDVSEIIFKEGRHDLVSLIAWTHLSVEE